VSSANPVRARQRRRLWLVLTAAAALLGMTYSVVINAVAERVVAFHAFEGLGYGAVIGGAWALFLIHVQEGRAWARLRRLSFLAALAAETAVAIVVVAAGYAISALTFSELARRWFGQPGSGHSPASAAFWQDLLFALAVIVVVQFVLRVRRIIGARVLGNFVLGRYHTPLREERIFLFIDLVGSTPLARELGDERAQAMITRFFFDIDQVTTAHGGETHRYIGDEVAVTWPLEEGRQDGTCLACLCEVRRALAARAADYEARFGQAPQFRAALHGGPVVAAECGDSKQEIVYFGDTINTAARIAAQCKALERPWLISRQLLDRLDLPADLRAETAARVQLTGHERDTELVAITELRSPENA